MLPEDQWPEGVTDADRQKVDGVRANGWAETTNEVITGLHSVGVPLDLRGGQAAALAAVFVGDGDRPAIAARLRQAADVISRSGA
jgi:DNA-binding IclR family transcriptional regulator